MKRILITGAGGFVGTHLIREILSQGNAEIFAAVYKSTSDVQGIIPADHIIEGDLTQADFAQQLIRTTTPDIIYHLAALSVVHDSATHALEVMDSNAAISYHLFEAIKTHAPNARIVAICSANVYGLVLPTDLPIKETVPLRPLNPYAISKITQEMLALQYGLVHGLDVIILRPFNHTGVGQTNNFVIPSLAQQIVEIEKGEKSELVVGNLHTTRDFTDVRDMVQAYLLATEHCQRNEIYNIGTGVGHSISDIIDVFRTLTKADLPVRVGEERARAGDVPVLIADATKFKLSTNWEPKISLVDSLRDILNYWRSK